MFVADTLKSFGGNHRRPECSLPSASCRLASADYVSRMTYCALTTNMCTLACFFCGCRHKAQEVPDARALQSWELFHCHGQSRQLYSQLLHSEGESANNTCLCVSSVYTCSSLHESTQRVTFLCNCFCKSWRLLCALYCVVMENDVFNKSKVVIRSKQTVVHLLDSGVPWHSGRNVGRSLKNIWVSVMCYSFKI